MDHFLLEFFEADGSTFRHSDNLSGTKAMSISILNSSSRAAYQWQSRLGAASATENSQKTSSEAAPPPMQRNSVAGQLASMIELSRYAMNAMGLDSSSKVTFSQIAKYRDTLTSEFNAEVRRGLAGTGVAHPEQVVFSLHPDGNLTAHSHHAADQTNVQSWLKSRGDLGNSLLSALVRAGLDDIPELRMTVSPTGELVLAPGTNAAIGASPDELQAGREETVRQVLREQPLGKTLLEGMQGLGVPAHARFTLKTDQDGTVRVQSEGAYQVSLQKFFDANPALVKKFRQIEALEGLDDARKAMQIPLGEMRKRIQIESLASWWAGSGQSTQYFGSYAESSLSLLPTLNRNV